MLSYPIHSLLQFTSLPPTTSSLLLSTPPPLTNFSCPEPNLRTQSTPPSHHLRASGKRYRYAPNCHVFYFRHYPCSAHCFFQLSSAGTAIYCPARCLWRRFLYCFLSAFSADRRSTGLSDLILYLLSSSPWPDISFIYGTPTDMIRQTGEN